MPDSGHDKSQLRAILRQRRQNLSAEQQETAANALAHQIGKLPQWPGANQIALYLPADGEIDTAAIAALSRQQDKQIFLPVIARDKTLSFALWSPNTRLIENRLLVIPGNVFSERDTHFRISFATTEEKIQQGVEILCGLV